MENIADYASLVCIVSVASGVIVFLIPDGKLKKTAEIVITLFLLLTVVSIFSEKTSVETDIPVNTYSQISDCSEEFNEYLIEQSKNVVEDIICKELNSVCNYDFSINTSWYFDSGTICMESVSVLITLADMSKSANIKSKIYAMTGIIPEVEYK